MNHKTFSSSALLLLLPIYAFGAIRSYQYVPRHDASGDHISFSWIVDSAMNKQDTLKATLIVSTDTNVTVPATDIQSSYESDKTGQPNTKFTASVPFGKNSSLNADMATELTARVTVPDTAASATTAAEISINPKTVATFIAALTEVERRPQASPPAPAPKVSAVVPAKRITDRSLRVEVASDKYVSAQAFAYPTSDRSQITGPTPYVSKPAAVFEGNPQSLIIPKLGASAAYIVALRDSTTNTDLVSPIAIDSDGNQIKTRDPIATPKLTFDKATNVKNEAVLVRLQSSDAKSVKLTLQVQDAARTGTFYDVPDSTFLVEPSLPNVFVSRRIERVLQPQAVYRVVGVAVPAYEDLPTSELAITPTFEGWKSGLFSSITVDVSDGINFTPVNVAAPSWIKVSANVAGILINKECKPDAQGRTPASCGFSAAEVQSKLAAATPSTDGVTFDVTLNAADESERTQTETVAFKIVPPDSAKDPKTGKAIKSETASNKDAWKSAVDFASASVNGDASKGMGVRGRSIATFLLMLVKGFI